MRGFLKESTRAKVRFALGPFSLPKPQARLVGLGCILLAGVLLGSMGQAAGAQKPYLAHFIAQYLEQHCSSGFAAAVGASFSSAMLMQMLVVFLGLSCAGTPFLIFVPMLRGIYIGCIGAFLYGSMGMRGLLANLILFWIPEVMQAVFLLILVNAALDTSWPLFRACFSSQEFDGIRAKADACLRCFVYTSLGMLAAALLEGALSAIFAPVLLP